MGQGEIYDSAIIEPAFRIKDNVAVWTRGGWEFYRIDYLEPIPPSPDSTVNLITASGATTLAAGGTITKQIVAIIQMNSLQLMHLRYRVLDYGAEVLLWEQSGQAKFKGRNIHARVDYNSYLLDPTGVGTTFFIIGRDRDANMEVQNASTAAIPMARVVFWGLRAQLFPLVSPAREGTEEGQLLRQGDPKAVRAAFGSVVWLPAEGVEG